jgi:hypothetical protein
MLNLPSNVWSCLAFCLLIAAFSLAGCKAFDKEKDESRTSGQIAQSEGGNFVLYVKNQSMERPVIDLEVRLDGKLLVQGEFRNEMHVNRQFQYKLSAGTHELTAVSKKGEARFEGKVTITGRHWAALEYFYASGRKGIEQAPKIQFRMQDEEIFFR